MSSVPTLDSQIVACSEVFRNDSRPVHTSYPKQDDEESVVMDTICLVEEIERKYSSDSKKESVSQFLHHTNQSVNEEVKSDFSSRYEDKEMLSPIDVNDFEYEDFSKGLSSAFTLDNKDPSCSQVFRNESQFI